MKKILCGQQKGGVGKSTLAGNIAVCLALKGQRVIIVDTDKQQSCVKWGSRRTTNNLSPEVTYATLLAERGNEGNKAFMNTFEKLAESGKFDVCIIDAGGRDNRELRLALLVSDILIAPSQPSQADIESLQEFDDLIGEVNALNVELKAYAVLNKCTFGLNFGKESNLARDAIAEMENFSDVIAAISDRPNYRATWSEGASVFDIDTESAKKAQAEIEGITKWL